MRGRVEAARCLRAVDISRAHRLEVDDKARDEDRCDSEGYKCSGRITARIETRKAHGVTKMLTELRFCSDVTMNI